jgi:hypothetical protein
MTSSILLRPLHADFRQMRWVMYEGNTLRVMWWILCILCLSIVKQNFLGSRRWYDHIMLGSSQRLAQPQALLVSTEVSVIELTGDVLSFLFSKVTCNFRF